MNITISNIDIKRFVSARAKVNGETESEVVEQLIERAIKDIVYRTQRNAQKWQERKHDKARLEELERRLAELGLEK